jgi:polysaccharide biosynthesis transport protein
MLSDPYENNKSMLDTVEVGDFRRHLYLFWHWTWLIALGGLVAAVSALLVSRQMTPGYETSTKLLVMEAPANRSADYNSILTSERLTRTYSDMMTNESIVGEVISRLALNISPADLVKDITVSPIRDTQLILITVSGADPSLIADIANTLVDVFIQKVKNIQGERFSNTRDNLQKEVVVMEKLLADTSAQKDAATDPADKDRLEAKVIQYRAMYASMLSSYEQARLAETQNTSNVVQVNTAQPPQIPVSPKTTTNTVLAGLLGMLMVAGIVYAMDALDDTLKTPDEVVNKLKLPVLGVIFSHPGNGHPVTEAEPRSPVSEAFRSLRTNIRYADVDHPIRSILVTSPTESEGKTTVSANLAVVLAHAGGSVVLLDADLRRPMVHRRFGLHNVVGLTNLLLRPDLSLDGALQSTSIPGLGVVTSGDLPPNPSEILGSQKMVSLLDKLLQQDHMVVIDSPPVLPVSDAAILAPNTQGVLLVIQPGSTNVAAARQAIENLRHVNAHILGVVLNNVDLKASRYNYYYRSGYRYYDSHVYSAYDPARKKEGNPKK